MTLKELREAWRLRVHDLRGRLLWTEGEANRFANEAQREAAERAKLLYDETTKPVCTIAGKADVATMIEDLYGKATALRTQRAYLREKREALEMTTANTTAVDAELAALAQKLVPIAVEAEARKVASRAARLIEAAASAAISNEDKHAMNEAAAAAKVAEEVTP